MKWRSADPALWLFLSAAFYGGLSAYFRWRPMPEGVEGSGESHLVPTDRLSFLHDTTWYESDSRRTDRHITDEVIAAIRKARRLVVCDVFLFNHHHTDKGTFIPTTRQIADAFEGKTHRSLFITDPLNTSYGTSHCAPLAWLEERGVEVCITDLEKLRDNNLLYAPLWKLFFRWFATGKGGWIDNPLRKGARTTIRAILAALTLRGNHRKVLVADDDDSWATILTSSNFEDSSCYFSNTGLKIRDTSVARHFLDSERAVARMSGCHPDFSISDSSEHQLDNDAILAEVTPLLGSDIRQTLLSDLAGARAGDELFLFALFLSDRAIIRSLVDADRRGVSVSIVLDRNNVSFGSKKSGYPNHIVAGELRQRSRITIRYANLRQEEFHAKLMLLVRDDECVLHTGSANFTRRSLSNTNLEAMVRVRASRSAEVCQDALSYVRRMMEPPFSYSAEPVSHSPIRFIWYRIQEATGIATF